jgi:Uma2 family endonuclease
MAKRAWKIPPEEIDELNPGDIGLLNDEQESYLERCVVRPDGTVELVSIPLTPEDFLNPQLGDKWVQGRPHGRACLYFADILERHFSSEEDVLVLYDVKLLTSPRRRGPAPDVMVVRGARKPDPDLESFDPVEQRSIPSLVIEVLSRTQRIRKKDQEDKVALYARVGIPDYLVVDPPRRKRGIPFQLKGYCMGPEGRYLRIEPDAQGRLLCASAGLRFGVSEQGDQIEVFDARTGERLLSSREEEAGRKAAEAELERLRAEIRQLKMSRP